MVSATDLKNGKTFLLEGRPFKVVKYAHQKIARGGGTVKLTLRNLETGQQEEKTFPSTLKVEEIATSKEPLHYLYQDERSAVFMRPTTFEQIEIPLSTIRDEVVFIKEGQSVDVLFWEEKPLSVDIPPKVSLKVVSTNPGIKGNSATNIFKPATLENGLKVKVPLFVNGGDEIRVDTRTGEYIERAN